MNMVLGFKDFEDLQQKENFSALSTAAEIIQSQLKSIKTNRGNQSNKI